MISDRIWILFAKKKSGEATAEELVELDKLLSENKEAGYSCEMLEKIWDAPMHALPEMNIRDSVWEKIEKETSGPNKNIVYLFKSINKYVAAAVLILFIAGTIFFINYNRNNKADTKDINVSDITKIATESISKSKIQLPDGTQVWLNANSQLLYNTKDFSKNIREVTLIGEAFFDVTTAILPDENGKKIPFIIHAGVVNITVKGTAFNVKAYPKQKNIETTLLRGVIEITTKQDPQRKIIVKPNEKIIIPSAFQNNLQEKTDSTETSLYSITRLKKDKHEVIPETVWMNSKLEFDNESF
jgi:transmembrane sensor